MAETVSAWRPIAESSVLGDKPFIARFTPGGARNGPRYYAVLEWDEGRLRFHDEGDTGRLVDEYTHFALLPKDAP